jgi:hypothetical protein
VRQIRVEHRTAADPERVIDAIWSGAEWESRWAAVRSFRVGYDDGDHQDATITLDWFGEVVEMEVVRFRTSPTRIDFFCPRPPPPLAHQSGRWCAEPGPGANLVVAARTVELIGRPSESAVERGRREDEYASRLSERLGQILAAFTQSLE